uniref:Peptidase S1 domain-containing protein n=1 Tax=Timema monikensis TaxID=170555 RepID=A0A7R9EGB6_9NEOP|nr:unnamed protein product [Timema monikensis]
MFIQQEFNDNSYPDILQSANIPIIDSEECQMIYGLDMGDSGGPLIFGNFQIGIVSFGRHCGHARNPGVYSKVAHYREWIDGIVGV